MSELDDVVEETQSQEEPEDDGFGVPYEEPGEESQEPDDGNSEVKPNPAWEAILNHIPEDKRAEVLPEFKKWDDNFAEVQLKYSPYKPLLDQGVKIEDIQKAFAFVNVVNTNPKALYDELEQRFNFGQGQKQVEKKEEEDDPDFQKEQLPDLTKHPDFVRMQETIQQFQQNAQQEAERQQAEQTAREVENEFSAIERELKVKLSPVAREEILLRTVKIGDRTSNYDLREGYKDYASFVNQIRNSRANASAPRVFSGSGSLPVDNKPATTDEERAAKIVAFLEAAGKQDT